MMGRGKSLKRKSDAIVHFFFITWLLVPAWSLGHQQSAEVPFPPPQNLHENTLRKGTAGTPIPTAPQLCSITASQLWQNRGWLSQQTVTTF